MIPKLLTLHNFLSYRRATLDFRGLHVACICGSNGAGKSSLLEAMVWALWGQSRVAVDDDIIHLGAQEAKVDFTFEQGHQTYRILRGQRRKQGSFLEFQIKSETGFRSLTQRGVRATQAQIIRHLDLDYETFIHSAYLRQGQADELMLKRPSERKQILSDLLKLEHYDQLAEKAKGQARDYRIQAQLIESTLTQLVEKLQDRCAIESTHRQLQHLIDQNRLAQSDLGERLTACEKQQQQHQSLKQALLMQQQMLSQVSKVSTVVNQELLPIQQQLAGLRLTLKEADAIEEGYQTFQALQAEEVQLARKAQTYQQERSRQAELKQQAMTMLGQLKTTQQQRYQDYETLKAQIQDLRYTLEKRTSIGQSLEQLQSARARLKRLDRLQLEINPLRQRHQELYVVIQREEARVTARLNEIINVQNQLETEKTHRSQLVQAVMDVGHRLAYLEQRQSYQEQVREKGQERRHFMERLQAEQRHCELQIAQLTQKIQLLSAPEACCPVCDRPLQDHGHRVLDQYRQEQQAVQDQIWVIREQLAVSEREIQVLRQEYREIEDELAQFSDILQQRGQLQVQLNTSARASEQLAQLKSERSSLERCLQDSQFAANLHDEFQSLSLTLENFGYDERDHALARHQVEKLRWAELKHAELLQAERRLKQLQAQLPKAETSLQAAQTALMHFEDEHPLQQALKASNQALQSLGYSLDVHQSLQAQLRDAQPWDARFQALQQARQQIPELNQRQATLMQQLEEQTQEKVAIASKIEDLNTQLSTYSDCSAEILSLTTQLKRLQTEREKHLSELGRLDQQLKQLEQLQNNADQQQQTLKQIKRKYQIYQALALAFGKKGIQALVIENLLPHLEAEANQILGRLSDHQLHIQFVTQRVGRQRHKLIDTLDILIADAQGTRTYETYSGGEAFRVNFAIRLALARLLAQRSGMALQMLIVDEGFGTQDQAGCDRLIAAINAIAPDFACILAITHMPHFREAFQTRIDIQKTEAGSQILISG